MTLLYHLLAREVLIDQETNTASAIKVIERVSVRESQKPFEGQNGTQWFHAPMTFLAVFRAEDGDEDDPQFSVTVRSPDGSEVSPLIRPVNFKGRAVSRCTIYFPGIPNNGEGIYAIVMRYGDQEAAWQFMARIVPAAEPEGVRNDPELTA